MRSPAGWRGKAFGSVCLRGWIKTLGSGRLFDEWEDAAITAVRLSVRDHIARWHKCNPSEMISHPERCSVKVAGCPELPAHLDDHREGTLQCVIALTQTSFLVWPGSHRAVIPSKQGSGLRVAKGQGYRRLDRQDLESLKENFGSHRLEIPAAAGDVLLFIGGRLVHSSPAVSADEPTRIMAYAHWSPPPKSN